MAVEKSITGSLGFSARLLSIDWSSYSLGSSARSSDESKTKVAANVRSCRLTRLAAKYWEYPEQPESRSRGQTVRGCPTSFLHHI